MTLAELLAWLRAKRVEVCSDGGRLIVRPTPLLSDVERSLVAEHVEELLAVLRTPAPRDELPVPTTSVTWSSAHRSFIRRGAFGRQDYVLDDTFEPRLGVEASFPLRGVSLQARAGFHGQATGALAYRGADVVEAAAFPGADRRLLMSAGGSLVTRSLRLDVGAVFGTDTNRVLLGGAVRC